MGIGDEIMAAGRAERIYRRSGQPVAILDRFGHVREHPAWLGNPAIRPDAREQITDGSGARPYIRRWIGMPLRVEFDLAHRPLAGHLYLSEEERAYAAALDLPERFAVIAPIVRKPSSPNKDWGFERWAEVAEALPLPVVQLGPADERPLLPGALRIVTRDFRRAAAIIERAAIVLATEGGAHHIAAALGRKAVVIFGAFTPPEVTGYAWHINLAVETPEGYCGRYTPCAHCAQALATITPAAVLAAAKTLLHSTH